MSLTTSIITLPVPLGMGSVNCFLLKAGDGHILIDTGAPNAQDTLRRELERLGCQPSLLNLIVLTHGDFDHTGNAVYIRNVFGSRIAMHADDAGMAEHGDMFANRKKSNPILRFLIPRFIGFGKSRRFIPDLLLEDSSSLSEYGVEASVVEIPGHSKGSIGILTASGEFFCGDLFENIRLPALGSIMDDSDSALRSAARVRSLGIQTVYPGHGNPFPMDQLFDLPTWAEVQG